MLKTLLVIRIVFEVTIDLQSTNSYRNERNVYGNFEDSERFEVILPGINDYKRGPAEGFTTNTIVRMRGQLRVRVRPIIRDPLMRISSNRQDRDTGRGQMGDTIK
jgi:hypothetical protein